MGNIENGIISYPGSNSELNLIIIHQIKELMSNIISTRYKENLLTRMIET
jgi:hypothetical protein